MHGQHAMPSRTSDPSTTLVLGLPNLCARHLVRHLLAVSERPVLALVRERDARELEAWRQSLGAGAERLELCEGDPSAIDLGLSGPEYHRLSERVTCIHHLAQVTDFGAARQECEAVNIGSTREALELARACKELQALVLHSNVCVSGDRRGIVKEHELNVGQAFSGPVDASLALSELMARRNMSKLPIVVLRSGRVVDDSSSPSNDSFDGVQLLILLILNSPQDLSAMLPPWGDAPLNVVNLSYLVRAAERLGREPLAIGRTFQLTDAAPLSIRAVFTRCLQIRDRLHKEEGLVLPPVSRVMRNVQSLQGILRRPRAFLSMNFRDVRYDTSGAEQLLGALGLSCPTLQSYLEPLVRHVAQTIGAMAPSSRESRYIDAG
jgi:thioester reductase-like protein